MHIFFTQIGSVGAEFTVLGEWALFWIWHQSCWVRKKNNRSFEQDHAASDDQNVVLGEIEDSCVHNTSSLYQSRGGGGNGIKNFYPQQKNYMWK